MNCSLPLLDTAFSDLSLKMQEVLQKQQCYPYSFLPNSIVEELCRIDGLTKEKLGIVLLPIAAAFAEVPVSNFRVGAVAFDSEGNAYLGANFEFSNTHIGQTIHAEQSAIAHAWSRGAKDLALLVINYPPCGHCRQFINEVNLANSFSILLPEIEPLPLSSYLPHAFGPADLGMEERILGAVKYDEAHGDIESRATSACLNSHAPYSQSSSGVSIKFKDGEFVTGRYAENAAFNPSLPPLQMALNFRRLQGKDWRAVEVVILVEKRSELSQEKNVRELLMAINSKIEMTFKTL